MNILVSNCCSSSVEEDQGLQIDPDIKEGICLECYEHCEMTNKKVYTKWQKAAS